MVSTLATFCALAFGNIAAVVHASSKTMTLVQAQRNSGQQLSRQGVSELQAMLDVALLADSEDWRFTPYAREADEFYASREYVLAWVHKSRPTWQAVQIICALERAEEKGLHSGDYDGPLWTVRLAEFDQAAGVTESQLIHFDVELTLSTMRLTSDLHVGRVNPQTMRFALDIQQKSLDLSQFLEQTLVNAGNPEAVLESVEPQFLTYRRTLQALSKYLALAKRDDGKKVPETSETIKPGDTYFGTAQLEKRLTLLGDLRGDSAGGSPMVYDGDVVKAVKRFQDRHGLAPDGAIDERTFKELNTPISRRIVQLELTLERWRWLPQNFERPPIIVNIPEYRLHLVDEAHHIVSSMNVVVGKAYHHETPVFTSEVRAVTFRPYWYVPREIQHDEIFPVAKNNVAYLSENSYEILDRHGLVRERTALDEDTQSKLQSGELLLRQQPGPDNSLGLMKLEMSNPYDVYLHGTPAQDLFSRSRRDFSHGCIRVEDPLALAQWVLRDEPEWTAERIRSAMNGAETMRVNLKASLRIWIVYGTAVVLEDGQIRFLEDVYGHDAALERALAHRDAALFK